MVLTCDRLSVYLRTLGSSADVESCKFLFKVCSVAIGTYEELLDSAISQGRLEVKVHLNRLRKFHHNRANRITSKTKCTQ